MTWKKIILLLSTSIVVFALSCTPPAPTLTPVTTPATTAVQNPDPWPGVSVYRDSNSPIMTRVNETFAIILPPAPLFGWGWQNKELSAFSLLETKTVPGSGNETNPYGPDAFLFKALKTGTFQITLYVPSKPPQHVESFGIIVNP
jgi:predicted secreted protein